MKSRKGKVSTEAKRRRDELQAAVPGHRKPQGRYPGTGRPFGQPQTFSPLEGKAIRALDRLTPARKRKR